MDPMSIDLTRRRVLQSMLIAASLTVFAPAAEAKDGGSDDDSDGGDNSGPGGGNDDDQDDSGDDSDDDDDTGSGRSGARGAQDAVRSHKAVPLRTLIAHLKKHYPGKILDIDLKRSQPRYTYNVKILSASGKVQRLRLDALTLQKI
jgi:hypothetical protein